MFSKNFYILILMVVFSLFIVSCSKEEKQEMIENVDSTSIEDSKTLDFRITWKRYSGRGEAIQTIVDTYNVKHKEDFNISTIDGDEDRNAIENLLESDSNTIFVLPYRYVKYFGDEGYLLDLTETFKDVEEVFYPEVWNLATVNERTYGIPWLGHSMCLLYNKSILKEAGVDPESIVSMDSFIKAIEVIEEKTNAKGIGLVGAAGNDISWMVNQFVYGFDSSLVSDNGKTVTVNNEKSTAALNFYKNILGKHAQPTWVNDTAAEVVTCFRKQEVAFEILGIWGLTDVIKNGSPFEVGIIPLKNIGLRSEVGPMMLALPSKMSEDNKNEAVRFIRYMISIEAQDQLLKGEYSPEHDAYYPFRTPIRLDMKNSEMIKSHPEYLTFIEGFQYPSIDVPVPAWQIIKDEIYGIGLHEVMNDNMDIEDFLKMVEAEGNKILNNQ